MKFKSQVKFGGRYYQAGEQVPAELKGDALQQLINAEVIDNGKNQTAQESTTSETGTQSDPQAPSESWSKAKLTEYAQANGVEITPEMTKKELVEAITASQEGAKGADHDLDGADDQE